MKGDVDNSSQLYQRKLLGEYSCFPLGTKTGKFPLGTKTVCIIIHASSTE